MTAAGFPFGSWDIPVMPITGHDLFDFFFSVVVVFSILGVVLGWLFNTVSRS